MARPLWIAGALAAGMAVAVAWQTDLLHVTHAVAATNLPSLTSLRATASATAARRRWQAETRVDNPVLRAVLDNAHAQVGTTISYDPAYRQLAYPGGDVPLDRGVCTDVVIRALRAARFDLQRAVHEDMQQAFKRYPQKWGLPQPDPNIDHRRVPNLQTYFERHRQSLPVSALAKDYLPGDLVTWKLDSRHDHIGIVSNRTTADGRPLVVHNIDAGAQLEDVLFGWTITGHYRPKLKI